MTINYIMQAVDFRALDKIEKAITESGFRFMSYGRCVFTDADGEQLQGIDNSELVARDYCGKWNVEDDEDLWNVCKLEGLDPYPDDE